MRPSRLLTTAAVAASALVLAACGADDTSSDTGADASASTDAAFPVTIEHVFGETVIEEKPERVASIAWMNHEVPLALGVVPVGMSKAAWGDDDEDGVLPWVEERLEELDAETPVLFDETEGIDFEAVADTAPDVILASYSGLTQEEYDTLSKIAPVVAYPEVAWGTTYQDMILMNSEALGLAEEGEELVEELDSTVTEAFAEHEELAGKNVVFSYLDPNDLSQIGFYTTLDTRPGFLAEYGMGTPEVVAEMSEGTDTFDDVDLFVTYGDESLAEAAEEDPLLSQIPAVEQGAIAMLPNSTPLAAAANPTPLSITYNLDEYLDLLAAALA